MDRVLFVFGILTFFFSLMFFVMNFIGEYDGIVMIVSLFGMLNAGIAIGVSELLGRTKKVNILDL